MIVDPDLPFLQDAATLVDAHLGRLDRAAAVSEDPDGFGILDQIEYITGFGFVACQTYLAATISRRKLAKSEALTLGPKHRTGRPIAQLSNELANHWKHSCEWSHNTPQDQAKRTIVAIESLGVDTKGPYTVANAMRELLSPLPIRFATLIPFLEQWRDALPRR